MKKYKLIKEYPGSPKLKDKPVVGSNDNETLNYWANCSSCHIDLETVKNSPEFWEEIIEKDYEILSFKSANGNRIVNRKGDKFYDSGLTLGVNEKVMLCVGNCVESGHWFINSVKRLSDGEVFTVGDKITGFTFSDPRSIVSFDFVYIGKLIIKQGNGICELQDIKKVKQPLFKTEDGVDIFEGDKCFFVPIKDDFIDECNWGVWDGNGNGKYFATKYAAERWVEEKKQIKIGDYPVEFCYHTIEGNFIRINGIIYFKSELLNLIALMQRSQIKSLNVGCQGQYKVDLPLLERIMSRLQQK